jgi:hypothetical protein
MSDLRDDDISNLSILAAVYGRHCPSKTALQQSHGDGTYQEGGTDLSRPETARISTGGEFLCFSIAGSDLMS